MMTDDEVRDRARSASGRTLTVPDHGAVMFNAARTVAFVECVVEVPLTDDPPVTFAPPRQVCDHGRTFSEECDYCEKELVFKRGPIP